MDPDQEFLRLPTRYSLHRTDSGRLSSGADSSDPEKALTSGKSKIVQIQNWPIPLRDVVIAPPGKVIIGADWAAIEWALAVWDARRYAKDPEPYNQLLDDFYHQKLDPHRRLASIAYQTTEELVTKLQRRTAKGFTFGYLYGGDPDNLSDRCRVSRTVGRRVCEAHDEAFGLRTWRRELVDAAVSSRRVETAGGWVRWFWEIPKKSTRRNEWVSPKPTEILATRIQGTAADLMKWVLASMFKDPQVKSIWSPNPEAWIELLTTLHDAVYIMVDESRGPEAQEWLRTKMQQSIPFLDSRSWRCEVKLGVNWRDVS